MHCALRRPFYDVSKMAVAHKVVTRRIQIWVGLRSDLVRIKVGFSSDWDRIPSQT